MNIQRMTVREATRATAVTVSEETTLLDAESLMLEAEATEIYVANEAGKLVGVIPDYDFLKRRYLNDSLQLCTRHIMSPVTIMLAPSAPLDQATEILRMNIHARIPVVVNGRVIGQVTRHTVLQALRKTTADLHTATTSPEWMTPLADNVIPAPKFLRKAPARKAVE